MADATPSAISNLAGKAATTCSFDWSPYHNRVSSQSTANLGNRIVNHLLRQLIKKP